MDFRLVDNQKEWNDFVSGQDHSQFLQSWSWGEFQKALGRRVWRVGMFAPRHSEPFDFAQGKLREESNVILNEVKDLKSNLSKILRRSAPQDDVLVGAAQIIEHYLGLGMGYLYCPRGPVCHVIASGAKQSRELWAAFFNFIKERIANYGHIFFRVEPPKNIQSRLYVGTISNIQYFRVSSIQPTHTLVMDLSQSEEDLLNQMHPKTRYNIRLAEKKGLMLSFPRKRESSSTANKPFDTFWSLLQETAKRDKIRLHPKKYYQLMNQILTKEGEYSKYLIFNIQYFNQWLAAGIFIGFGNTLAYVHGASSRQHRELMASYLLHWEAIKFAKLAGYRYYDFGGLNPDNPDNPDFRISWTGLTRFKKGFGGLVHSYPGTYDVVLNKLGYKIYQSAREVNYLIRG